jgi:beta-glucuronidase
VTPQPRSEENQADFLEMHFRVFGRVDGNHKGVFTRDRRPKAAAVVLRRRWRGDA